MNKQSKPKNAYEHLELLKEQSENVQMFLYKNNYSDYVKVNNKLKNCSDASIVIDNRINQQLQSCDSIFCPICSSTHKIRRECAIAYGVIDKINKGMELDNGRKTSPILHYLTLTIPKEPIFLFEETFKQLKYDFKLYLKTKMKKKSGKTVTINQSLLGSSVYYHLALDDDDNGNPVAGVHLHAILMLKPSFAGVNSITKDMIRDYWMIVTGHRIQLETSIVPLPSTRHDFKNNHAYNLAKFDFDSIISNPTKFIALLPYIQGQRFNTHTGLIRTYRKEVRNEYKLEQEIKHKAQMKLDIANRIDAYEIVED